jgi:hypothetical protein
MVMVCCRGAVVPGLTWAQLKEGYALPASVAGSFTSRYPWPWPYESAGTLCAACVLCQYRTGRFL